MIIQSPINTNYILIGIIGTYYKLKEYGQMYKKPKSIIIIYYSGAKPCHKIKNLIKIIIININLYC